MLEKPSKFSASNYYISQFYSLAKRCGLDADTLFKNADIDLSVVGQPHVRVSADKLAHLVKQVWDLLDDEAMGLGASRLPRGAFEMMGALTIHESTLRAAIEQARKFYSMVTQAFKMKFAVADGRAILRCVLKEPELDPQHLLSEFILMGWHRYFSWLIAENIMLEKVYFNYAAPNYIEEYMYLFPGKHEFDQEILGFSFPTHYLECKNVQNADSLRVFMQNCPAELFKQPRVDFSLTGAVVQILKRTLTSGFPTIEQTAQELHLTKRTLIRRLNDEGAAFQKLKDTVRRDRASYLLSKNVLSVQEVSEQLGFSDSAVFARAFKNWTGMSPSEYQRVPRK